MRLDDADRSSGGADRDRGRRDLRRERRSDQLCDERAQACASGSSGCCGGHPRPPNREPGHRLDKHLSDRHRHGDTCRRRPQRAKALLEGTAGAENQRLDRGNRDSERRRDLVIAQTANLAQHDRLPLGIGKLEQRGDESGQVGPAGGLLLRALGRDHEALVEGERLAHPSLDAGATLVAGDRPEPGGRVAWIGSRQKALVRREKGLLSGVLGVLWVMQEQAAQAVHHAPVLLVEVGEACAGRPTIGAAGLNPLRLGDHRHRGYSSSTSPSPCPEWCPSPSCSSSSQSPVPE